MLRSLRHFISKDIARELEKMDRMLIEIILESIILMRLRDRRISLNLFSNFPSFQK